MSAFSELLMEHAESAPALIFLHVHKTAGQTFNHILYRLYPADACCHVDADAWRNWPAFVEQFRQETEFRRRAFAVVEGHMYFGLHALLPQRGRYVTFLREPRARTVSLFEFIRRNPRVGPVHRQVVDSRLDLAGYLARGLHLPADNGQTRFISGITDRRYGECDVTMLEAAKRNLDDSFLLAGLLENFDESLLLLQDLLGWREPWYRPVNVAPTIGPRDPLSPATLAQVDRYNVFDQELYHFARSRLHALLERRGEAFQARVRRFRRQMVVYRLTQRVSRHMRGLVRTVANTGLKPPGAVTGR